MQRYPRNGLRASGFGPRAPECEIWYHLGMSRWVLATVVLAGFGGVATAESFSGFSGIDRYYQLGPDRVCVPLKVTSAKATGVPKCEKATTDTIAQLSIKTPTIERGAKARFKIGRAHV